MADDNSTVDPGPSDGGPPRRVGASRFCGPQFIINLEGVILGTWDAMGLTVTSQRFTGEKTQQWLIHADPDGMGTVALASMEDGKYLRGYDGHALSRVSRVPYYWNLTEVDHNIYTLSQAATRGGRLELPTTVGAIATVTIDVPDETNVRFIILEATPESHEILSTGAIGPYACPEESVYYTVGTPGQVTVMNHMEADIYATISGEIGGGLQRKGSPGNLLTWGCDKDEAAHVSMAGSLDGQAGQVFTAYRGKILHIQKMPTEPVWQGIKSVPVEDAKYSPQEPGMEGKIVVQNDLAFYIYVAVLCSVLGEGAEDLKWTRQFALKPGGKDSSSRINPEVVFVSVGSSPGVPRAFIGRPGFILHIDTPH